ncbi:hypothetical protein [Streptomyces sp. NPDC056304]|uniref:hypothetical protein n=1 Tax=Streptomyces sp. NPDC056304 TaxID=3345778 RepID=UPI0035E26869
MGDPERSACRVRAQEGAPPAIRDTFIDLPMSFQVPAAFTPIDFTVSAEANTDRLIERLNMVDPRPADEEIAHAVLAQQSMYELLSAAGAVYAGTLLYGPAKEEPEAKLASAVLTVTARPSELSNERAGTARLPQASANSANRSRAASSVGAV